MTAQDRDHVTTATYAYVIEVSEDGEIWYLEDPDAIGTETTEQTAEGLAAEILDNRLDDLGENAPEHIRCVVWEGERPDNVGLAAAIATRHDSDKAAKPTITSAEEWADALDAEMKRTGQDVGTLISFGYANGQICGVELDPEHPDADDERAVIASTGGWVVGYDHQSRYWTAR